MAEAAGGQTWIHLSQNWCPSKCFSLLSRTHNLVYFQAFVLSAEVRRRHAELPKSGFTCVTKAWVNFNSASNESASKLQNIRNRPSTWRRAGSPWNLSLFRWKDFVVSELFAFSAWYIHHAGWLSWLRTNNPGMKGCTDPARRQHGLKSSRWKIILTTFSCRGKRYYVRPLKKVICHKIA